MNNLKIGYMCHEAYWPMIKNEGEYLGYDINMINPTTTYTKYKEDIEKNEYDVIMLFNNSPFFDKTMDNLVETAKLISETNNKKVTISYCTRISDDKRIDNDTQEIQMISYDSGEKNKIYMRAEKDFRELDLLYQTIDYHNQNLKIKNKCYIKK